MSASGVVSTVAGWWIAPQNDRFVARLQELGRVDANFANEVQKEVDQATANLDSRVITPLVLEIIAEKIA